MEEQAPYNVSLDPDQALKLVKAGGSLLLLDVPPSTSVGIDLEMFVVGPNFKGLKMLPPGPHFVYYSATSRHENDTSPITGFFLHMEPSQVIVRCWDLEEERLIKLMDSSEEQRYVEGVSRLEFDHQLAPYNLPHHATWQHVSNYLTPAVIDRLQPLGGDISIMAETTMSETHHETPAERRLAANLAAFQERTQIVETSSNRHSSVEVELSAERVLASPSTQTEEVSLSGRCFYTRLPHLIKPVGMVGSELTALNMDKSKQLESVLRRSYGGAEDLLLGELQFAFIAFLMGQSLQAFGQWKAIVSLLLSCEDAPLHSHTQLFIKFLEVVYWQLKQSLTGGTAIMEGPVLDDSWFCEDNFLRFLFKDFFALIKDAQPIDGELLRQAKRLKKLVETRMGWNLDNVVSIEMDDEYAPVVVYEESTMLGES